MNRYHDYFRGCKDAIAEALGAKPYSRTNTGADYAYQDFVTPAGEWICVYLSCSDHDVAGVASAYTNSPTVRLGVDIEESADREAFRRSLEATTPPGLWRSTSKLWDRPCVWRYLDSIISDGTFEEQRLQLAEACGQALQWLESARTRPGPPS